jgi:hypothetical protein
MLRQRSCLSALAVLAFLAACSGDPTGPNADISGSYTLQSVNGNALPWMYLVFGGRDFDAIASGGGEINADGTYRLTLNFVQGRSEQRITSSGTTAGTYTRNGSAITFTDRTSGRRESGTVSGRQLSVTCHGGYMCVFRRN